MKKLRAIDLCCGAGGWACAAAGLPLEITLAVDLWEPAARTYQLNHPATHVITGDLRDEKVRAQVLDHARGCDVILGGIPCEWISVYRHLQKAKAAEIDQGRQTLDSVLAIVKELDPRWWCLEDVIAIVKHLPLMTPYHTLNARLWSPQRRKRVYVGDFPLPRPAASSEVMRDRLRPGPYRIGRRSFGRTPQTHGNFQKDKILAAFPDRKAPTIGGHSSRRDSEVAIVDPALPGGMRQIEWQEAARLQGFPESYVFWGSPTDVGLMVGRAVQIDTARAILGAMTFAAAKSKSKQGAFA